MPMTYQVGLFLALMPVVQRRVQIADWVEETAKETARGTAKAALE